MWLATMITGPVGRDVLHAPPVAPGHHDHHGLDQLTAPRCQKPTLRRATRAPFRGPVPSLPEACSRHHASCTAQRAQILHARRRACRVRPLARQSGAQGQRWHGELDRDRARSSASRRPRPGCAAALTDADHEALVLAMALDTVAAALASPVVGRVVVVTADPVPGDAAVVLGAELIADVPDAGLNPALAYAAALVRRTGATRKPARRRRAHRRPAGAAHRRADRGAAPGRGDRGRARPARPWRRPELRRRRQRHRHGAARGAARGACSSRASAPDRRPRTAPAARCALTGAWPSLRRDVDTAADLAEAFVLGVGARTAVGRPGRPARTPRRRSARRLSRVVQQHAGHGGDVRRAATTTDRCCSMTARPLTFPAAAFARVRAAAASPRPTGTRRALGNRTM